MKIENFRLRLLVFVILKKCFELHLLFVTDKKVITLFYGGEEKIG